MPWCFESWCWMDYTMIWSLQFFMTLTFCFLLQWVILQTLSGRRTKGKMTTSWICSHRISWTKKKNKKKYKKKNKKKKKNTCNKQDSKFLKKRFGGGDDDGGGLSGFVGWGYSYYHLHLAFSEIFSHHINQALIA